MTDVTCKTKWLGLLLLSLAALAPAQSTSKAESLYLKLRSVGLDSSKVYRIRHANLDRASLHFSLDDGTIAFTQDVDGRITGALFLGEGELLVAPPNTVERASLALFTGVAILEERISLAYFRFNDDLFNELKGSFREADDASTFAEEFKTSATGLAQGDALRLLISFWNSQAAESGDHFLHAYIQGTRLGAFEARYDSLLPEQVSLGQHKKVGQGDYYDVWASFSPRKQLQGEADPDEELLSARDFEITHFTLRTEIKLPNEIASVSELSVTPKRNGTRVLVFELSRLLQVQSVEAGGKQQEFIHNQSVEGSRLAKRGNDWLVVLLGEPTKAGEPIQLKLTYSGSVLSQAANGLVYVGERGTWYPNIGFSMASFDLEFRYPLGWTLVAVGRRTELKTDGGQQVSRWVTERKVPVAGFNLGKYSHTTNLVAGVRLETYATPTVEKNLVASEAPPPMPEMLQGRPGAISAPAPLRPPPPSPSRNLEMVSNLAGQAVEFYSKRFGPYPYDSLSLTQLPGSVSQGWPGLIFLSTYGFLNQSELEQVEHDPVERISAQQLVAHETAHQWWGDMVTFNGYRDQWMMEALANYSAMMLLESRNPTEFHKLMKRYRDNLLAKGPENMPVLEAGPVTLGVRLSSSKFPAAYEAISYGRGTWLFHMMRTMMRDAEQNPSGPRAKNTEEPFVRALRDLRKQYEDKNITTAQLLAALETQLPKPSWYEGKKSLEWFYDSWINGTAVPTFELHDVKIVSKEGPGVVTGRIVQDHAPETLVTAVPMYAVVGNKTVFLRHVFAEGAETSFRIPVPKGTRKILLDPEETLLSRAK